VVTNKAGNIGIVFDDEDAWFHGFHCNEGGCQYLEASGEFAMATHSFHRIVTIRLDAGSR
jgi:hypothetical protein